MNRLIIADADCNPLPREAGDDPLKLFTNCFYFTWNNAEQANDKGEIQQDWFVKISTEQDLTKHCASLAQMFSRHPNVREVFDVAIAMSLLNDQKQN